MILFVTGFAACSYKVVTREHTHPRKQEDPHAHRCMLKHTVTSVLWQRLRLEWAQVRGLGRQFTALIHHRVYFQIVVTTHWRTDTPPSLLSYSLCFLTVTVWKTVLLKRYMLLMMGNTKDFNFNVFVILFKGVVEHFRKIHLFAFLLCIR